MSFPVNVSVDRFKHIVPDIIVSKKEDNEDDDEDGYLLNIDELS